MIHVLKGKAASDGGVFKTRRFDAGSGKKDLVVLKNLCEIAGEFVDLKLCADPPVPGASFVNPEEIPVKVQGAITLGELGSLETPGSFISLSDHGDPQADAVFLNVDSSVCRGQVYKLHGISGDPAEAIHLKEHAAELDDVGATVSFSNTVLCQVNDELPDLEPLVRDLMRKPEVLSGGEKRKVGGQIGEI